MWSVPGMAADPENCQLCHRYSGLAVFTPQSGTKKIFYVNEAIYRNTVHGNVQCTHCHKDVKEIPHKPAKKVNCGVKCHVKEPSIDKDFSHKPISRTSPRWTNREIVDLCNRCHANEEMMKKFMLDTTANFKDTFHWRNVKYEMKNGAHCLSCHAFSPLGYTPHGILKSSDPNSPIHMLDLRIILKERKAGRH